MTRRATLRGEERTPLDERADVLICGASFAGLAVARELAGSGADVLVVDRYEIGERATCACAAPTPWLHADGRRSARSARRSRAWRSTRRTAPRASGCRGAGRAFDYRELCQELWEQSRRPLRDRQGRGPRRRHASTPTAATLTAPLIVDALGWRRVLGPGDNVQPPEARDLARPRGPPARRRRRPRRLDRPLARSATATRGRCPPTASSASASAPTSRATTSRSRPREIAARLGVRRRSATRATGSRTQLRPAAEDGVFFVGDSAGHCFPLSGEGIRTAFYFGIACRPRAARGARRRADARGRARAPTARSPRRHARAFALRAALQRAIPALPPRLLAALLGRGGPRARRAGARSRWYLDARPTRRFAAAAPRIALSDGRRHRLRRARPRALRHPGLAHRRGADARLHERARRSRARARPASCTSGAARATSCGTRARPPGNTQAVKALRYDCDADACSRSSSPPAPPATPASAPASTTASSSRRAARGAARRSSARSPTRSRRRPRAPTPPSCSPTRR